MSEFLGFVIGVTMVGLFLSFVESLASFETAVIGALSVLVVGVMWSEGAP